jgi:hypothetical protein
VYFFFRAPSKHTTAHEREGGQGGEVSRQQEAPAKAVTKGAEIFVFLLGFGLEQPGREVLEMKEIL